MPRRHRELFTRLRPFHRTDDAVFVHAGFDPDAGPLEQQNRHALVWGLGHDFPNRYEGAERVVYGHHDNAVIDTGGWPRPAIRDELTYGIDTISHGVLTAVRMPDGKVFQSERFR